MTRTPLRPLARILNARQKGENPDSIERENLRLRHEVMRDKSRGSAQVRLVVLALCFFGAFTLIGARMGTIAASEPVEPRTASAGTEIDAGRADIVDRNGRVLAEYSPDGSVPVTAEGEAEQGAHSGVDAADAAAAAMLGR